MNMSRRAALRSTLALVSSTLLAKGARAQDPPFPTKPIRTIVPYSVGTPPDVVTRIIAAKMTTSLGQSVYVENRPGATGTVGLAELLRQPPDGYTIMTMLQPISVAPALYPGLTVDLARDLGAVGQFTSYCNVLAVHPSIPAKTAAELVALLKARPNDYNFGSGGSGTPAHLAGELFKQQAGVSATHVPYNQFPQAVGDLLQGRLQFMFVTSSVIVPHIQTGRVRALAVTGTKRISALPDVPTMIEAGFPDFDVSGWDGFVVRSGTPEPIITRLNRELAKAVKSPDVTDRFQALGVDPVTGGPTQFSELIAAESKRWGSLVRSAGIKAE
ncbi:Bug family tripartite tricarboxylate transporter substrate binding protein [Achromobacter aegrifaciens]